MDRNCTFFKKKNFKNIEKFLQNVIRGVKDTVI